MNNNFKRKCLEIAWIFFQVLLTFFLSIVANLKAWSVYCKLTYFIVLLVITACTWFFDDIKKIISKIHRFKVVVCFLDWLDTLLKKVIGKISKDSIEFLIVISNILKIVYICTVVILIRALLIGKNSDFEKLVLNLAVLCIFIFLCVTLVSISLKELNECTRNIMTIFILVIIVFIQLVKFKEVFVALILAIIIPTVNWYFSKERLYFFNETKKSSPEDEKKWAIYKTHSLMFSIAIGIVLIIKDALNKDCKEAIIKKFEWNPSIITSNLFDLENQGVHPNMVMILAVVLIYLVLILILKGCQKVFGK